MNAIGRRANPSSDVECDMMWVQTASGRRCGECEVAVERWVLHNDRGYRVAEVNFCPVCYPNLERIFQACEQTTSRVTKFDTDWLRKKSVSNHRIFNEGMLRNTPSGTIP